MGGHLVSSPIQGTTLWMLSGMGIQGGECVTSLVVLPQQRFEMADQCYSSVTAQLFLASKGKYTPNAWGWADPKGEASICLGFLLLYICLLPTPWACPMQIWLAKKGMCLFHLKFSLLPLWIFFCSYVLFLLCRLFSLLSFSHCHFGLCFPIPTT